METDLLKEDPCRKISNGLVGMPKIVSDIPKSNESMWDRKDIQVNEYLAAVYKTGFIKNNEGVFERFKDTTNPLEGRHLYNLVRDNKYLYTMEIGFAMGASAAWICQAHKDNGLGGIHIAIDPNQTMQYNNMGRILIERCGLEEYLTVIEKCSYTALPELLKEIEDKSRPKFNLIYIDGWHTFDYTLIDFFYSDLLLEINGVIALDDIRHKSVQQVLSYIKTNYPHYKIVKETPVYKNNDLNVSTQATFIKLSKDKREWNYHIIFR